MPPHLLLSFALSFDGILYFVLDQWLLVSLWLSVIFLLLMLNRLRSGTRINSAQLVNLINAGDAVIVDVRPPKEYSEGHIQDALNIPVSKLDKSMHLLDKHREQPLVLVCKMGQNSPSVARTLGRAGYNQVHCLVRGILGWQDDSLPLVKK